MDFGYPSILFRAFRARNWWEHKQFFQFFPTRPCQIYSRIERAGFSPAAYRASSPDLIDGLPSDKWSSKHFIQFMDDEVKMIRRFPLKLDILALSRIGTGITLKRRYIVSVLRNLVQSQIDSTPDLTRDHAFWLGILPALQKFGWPVIFIGDSHTRVFRQTIPYKKRYLIPINILCGGGSASGLPKEKSRSGYGALLRDALAAIKHARALANLKIPICLNFGQVDLEFVYTYKRLKRNEFELNDDEFKSFCQAVSTQYITWVSDLIREDCFILGTNPPCLNNTFVKDAYKIQMQTYFHGNVADAADEDNLVTLLSNFEQLSFTSKRDRTEHHRYFNSFLRSNAERVGVQYADSFDRFIGPDGCIGPEYSCANDGGELRVGIDGVDIHVGGPKTLQIQAELACMVLTRSLKAA